MIILGILIMATGFALCTTKLIDRAPFLVLLIPLGSALFMVGLAMALWKMLVV